MTLTFDKLELPFSRGLNQKADGRLVQEPELVRAVNVEFDDLGGLRMRYPYAAIGSNIFGGGTISDCRRIYAVGSELILFTSTAMYSWSSQRAAWVLKGTHLAAKVEEKPAFIDSTEQTDCDRAQLNGTVVYAWAVGTFVYVAAQDATTGAVLMSPTQAALGGSAARPRLCALSTRIILLYEDTGLGGGLMGISIDPADPTAALAGAETSVLSDAAFDQYYDVERIPGTDTAVIAARRDVTTSYSVKTVTSALVDIESTEPVRTCDGPIAVACTPDGAAVLVVLGNGANVEGDILDLVDLSDIAIGVAIGAGGTLMHVTAAFVDNTTARVFWSSSEATDATDWDTDTNTVTTSSVVGAATRLIRRCALASRAFAYDGDAFVWLAFAGLSSFSGANPSAFRAQLQSSYFLYRHDALLVAKAAWHNAGGLQTVGWLSGVQLTSGTTGFSWCGIERRVIPVGEATREIAGLAQPIQQAYGDKGPRDVTITFDSNDSRRVAKSGETVYITSALGLLQYDGKGLTECGWLLNPHYFGAIETGAGNLVDGVYTLKVTWRYGNARGERERSTTATHGQVTIAGGPNGIAIPSWTPLYVTLKDNVAVEVWRSAVNSGAPFFLASSPDPSVTANPNRHVTNDSTASTNATFNDEYADATLTTKEPNPENDGVLENLAPPAATLIAAGGSRLFLAGIAGDPHAIVYSKQRNVGEVAAFHEALAVRIPEAGGAITALAFLNETLIVFRETAVYVVEGEGLSNIGAGTNYSVRLVSNEVGAVSHEAVALVPAGLAFKSRKGWCLLNRGLAVDNRIGSGYIGAAVSDYDSETVYAVHVVESQHQMRVVTSGRVLVWDYLVDAWAEWSISDGLHACIWNGAHHVLATAAVNAQQTSHATTTHGADVEMLVHVGQLQGIARVRRILELGEYRSPHTQRWRIGGYEEGVYHQDKTWTPSGYAAGDELEEQLGLTHQQVKVVRVRITTAPLVDTFGEQLRLSALTFDVGMKRGVFPNLPAARRH